jgi:hypothetical protein
MGTMWLHDSLELLAIALHEKKRQGITIRDSMNKVKIVCSRMSKIHHSQR